MAGDWFPLGALDPHSLVDARLALHAAAQPLAAAAYALCPPQSDHSHSNLLWSREHHGLSSRKFPNSRRGLLRVSRLRLDVLDGSGDAVGGLKLGGMGLDDALKGFGEVLRHVGEAPPETGLKMPSYELPAELEPGAFVFPAPDVDALHELARWIHDGALALVEVAVTELHSAEVRGWPHHFDFAALRTLDAGVAPEQARSIGAGLSLGDAHYSEPYFYVSPWPYPDADRLPALEAGGAWRTEGFTSAILLGSEVASEPDAAKQRELVTNFLRTSVRACAAVLER